MTWRRFYLEMSVGNNKRVSGNNKRSTDSRYSSGLRKEDSHVSTDHLGRSVYIKLSRKRRLTEFHQPSAGSVSMLPNVGII
jgi:hypothetical protein